MRSVMKKLNPHLRYSDVPVALVLAIFAAWVLTYALIYVVKGR